MNPSINISNASCVLCILCDLNNVFPQSLGVLVEAMKKGHWIILDELNLAPTDVLEALNRVSGLKFSNMTQLQYRNTLFFYL